MSPPRRDLDPVRTVNQTPKNSTSAAIAMPAPLPIRRRSGRDATDRGSAMSFDAGIELSVKPA
jgi:hypothetical protein